MKIKKILNLTDEIISDSKLHCATKPTGYSDDPLMEFYEGTFKEWQENQNQDHFNTKYIFALISYRSDEWIFAGIYEKISVIWNQKREQYNYETKLTKMGKELIGRLIVKFHRHRNCFLVLKNQIDKIDIIEILREKLTVTPYTGNENIILTYSELKNIIKKQNVEWQTALSSIKGIYVITDLETGKLYIGSASGKQSFWQRWTEYLQNLHGSNKELKELLKEEGEEYVHNFQFSILEVMSPTTTQGVIIERENHWKEAFKTREFGYNKN